MEQAQNKHTHWIVRLGAALVWAGIVAAGVKFGLEWLLGHKPLSEAHNPETCSTVLAGIFGFITFVGVWENPPAGKPPGELAMLLEALAVTLVIVGALKLGFLYVLANEPGGDPEWVGIFTTVCAVPCGVVVWLILWLKIWDDYHKSRQGPSPTL